MGPVRRFLQRLTESDEARLAEEIREWADKVPGSLRIGEAPVRQRVKIAGVIRRLTVFPMEDNESLEALVYDGTGEVVVRFMGRRAIGGLGLGTRVVVEGVLGERRGTLQMMNPRLEFTA
jgi:RecG-like helicase